MDASEPAEDLSVVPEEMLTNRAIWVGVGNSSLDGDPVSDQLDPPRGLLSFQTSKGEMMMKTTCSQLYGSLPELADITVVEPDVDCRRGLPAVNGQRRHPGPSRGRGVWPPAQHSDWWREPSDPTTLRPCSLASCATGSIHLLCGGAHSPPVPRRLPKRNFPLNSNSVRLFPLAVGPSACSAGFKLKNFFSAIRTLTVYD